MRNKIAGIFTTIFVAFTVLMVSFIKCSSVTNVYSQLVFAESDIAISGAVIDYKLAYPGKVLPDNPLWYIKVVRDKIWLFFTFDKTKKSELNLLFADKRLYSAIELFKNNKPDLGLSTLSKAEKYLDSAVSSDAKNPDYLKKLALASLKHREVIDKEILPITPEDLKPEVIKSGDYSRNVYKKTRDLLRSIGHIPPQNPFETE